MLSDSIFECIYDLLKDTFHYSQDPWSLEYALEHEKHLIEALTNLYYMLKRLDHPHLDKYKESKIMQMAREESVYRIQRIKDGLDPFDTDSE